MIDTVKGFVTKFNNDWVMNLASLLAYNILTTVFPILLALLTILSFLLSWNHQLLVSLQQAIVSALPAQLQSSVDVNGALKALSSNSGILLIITILGLLWTGSNLFGAMENTFAIIYRTRTRPFIAQKLMAVAMILIFVVLTPIMFIASTLVSAFGSGAAALIPISDAAVALFFKGISLASACAVAFVLFLAVYTVVPNLPLSFRHAWRGALASGILLVVVNQIFPTYVSLAMRGSRNYGGTIYLALIFVAWCWFFAIIVLIGAEVNSYAMGIRATDEDLANFVHRARVHEEGKDIPPSHEDTTRSGRGLEAAAGTPGAESHQETAAEGRPPQPQDSLAHVMGAVRHAAATVLGTLGNVILAVSWLVYRVARRRGEPAA
jgi:YihY family inner membrane protein